MGYEIIEHTADVGVRAWGASLLECFEQSALGVLAINGAFEPGDGERVPVSLDASDVGGLLVDWISEILYLHEARDALVTAIDLARVDESSLEATVSLAPRRGDIEGTAVKAVTYHRLSVAPADDRWEATFYLDV
ncbi:MAG: archease [Actinomycetota bacterium]|nr:archease [Actinomycetota bacterium]